MIRILNLALCLLLFPIAFNTAKGAVITAAEEYPQELLAKNWKLDKITDYGTDITSQYAPYATTIILFKKDGSFTMKNGNKEVYSGKFMYDGKTKEITIYNAQGQVNNTSWKLSFKDNQMTWQGDYQSGTTGIQVVFHTS
ncbi:hypothetical protein AAG747_15230 [Rapidithrix thailandica]|uniref:Uncharacterized protein n=1 Tax=Rapidithrix thailandica TaxID=413964 RepID=A0AAW9SBW3_9BACT